VLGRSITKLCFEGTEEDLKHTINSQPAILAVSMAAYEALIEKSGFVPDFLAGHSLGEFTALYAGGVIERDEVISVVQKRADLMSNAPEGSMAAVLGLNDVKLQEVIEKSKDMGIITAANYNTPDQTVISGEILAVEKASILAKEAGAKRVMPLAVSGGFHSNLMKPLAEVFAKYINDTNVNDSRIPVVTNVDAKLTVDKAEFSSKMIKQMYSSVFWKQSVQYMLDEKVEIFFEIGPGKVLSGMIKKMSKTADVYSIFDANSLREAIDALKSQVGVL
jgi:[acyl-carrier-protein] S-malonyltransferase